MLKKKKKTKQHPNKNHQKPQKFIKKILNSIIFREHKKQKKTQQHTKQTKKTNQKKQKKKKKT
ncbi:hypothetical protein OHF13_27450, partial [Escherichia coli]|uniref:hypothetical protein n=1 Tax=Escherichia coli TaxID=562 RepID=UPI0021E75983